MWIEPNALNAACADASTNHNSAYATDFAFQFTASYAKHLYLSADASDADPSMNLLEQKGHVCGEVLHGKNFLNADICYGLAIFGMSARDKWS